MSRTYVHTPAHIRAQQMPDSTIWHHGCEFDLENRGRLVRYDEHTTHHDAGFGTKIVWAHTDLEPGEHRGIPNNAQRATDATGRPMPDQYWHCGQEGVHECSDPLGEKRRWHTPYRIEGWIDAWDEIVRTPVFEHVPCDVDDPDSTDRLNRCQRFSDTVSRTVPRGCARESRQGAHRSAERNYTRLAAEEYNTFGEIETEDTVPWRW